MTAKTVNYTQEQTLELVAAYTAAPTTETVEKFAKTFGRSVRSIVAKLSREGCYQKKEYTTKTGEKPVAKEALSDAIGKILALPEADTSSLAKANKAALQAVFNALASSKPL